MKHVLYKQATMEEKKKNVYIVRGKTDTYKVYGKEKDAMVACEINDPEEITSIDDDNMFDSDKCTRMHIGLKSTRVFILDIIEDKGGESYGYERWESAHESERDMILSALSCYDNEHDRRDGHYIDRCKRCVIDKKECKKRFISRMKGRGYSQISPDIFATSYKVEITQ